MRRVWAGRGRRWWPGLLVLLSLCQGVWASPPHFESVGRGVIPRDVVRSLAQDAQGFLWIATGNGLVRHDGYVFHPVGFDRPDPARRNLGWVQAMLSGRDGRLWISTEAEGLAVHDPAQARIDTLPPSRQPQLPAQVLALAEGPDGAIWAGTVGAGLLRHEVDQDAIRATRQWRHRPSEPGSLPDDRIEALAIDGEGSLWVGSWAGLARLRAGSDRFETVDAATDGRSLKGRRVLALRVAADGRLWVGTQQGDLVVLDPRGGPPRWLEAPAEGGRGATTALTQTGDGRFWVGTSRGLEVWDAQGRQRLDLLRPDPGRPGSLAGSEVTALLTDRAGALWVGGLGIGLQRHDPGATAIRVARAQPAAGFDGNVHGLLALDDGQVWAATASVPLMALDAGLRPRRVLVPARADATGTVPRFDALAQARDGTVWLATHTWLIALDRSGRERERLKHGVGQVIRLLPAPDGGLWLATRDGLFFRRPGPPRTLIRTRRADGSAFEGAVHALAVTPDGALWVAATAGLWRLPPGRLDGLEPVRSPAGKGLAHPVATGLLVDGHGQLWVDTAVNGLHRLMGLAGGEASFDAISQRHGVHNRPYGVNLLEDERGRIWTQQFVYDPATDELTELASADGMDFGMGWFYAYTRTRDGRLLFGGTRGVLEVSPEAFAPSRYMPALVLTSLRIDGQRVPAAARATRVELGPEHHSLAFEFAALEYADPQRIRYAYRLEGVDADWVHTGAEFRVANYGNLAPGSYTLRVRSTNRNGRWSDQPLGITLDVAPAWWQRASTRVVGAAVALALLGGVFQWRTRSLRRRQRELEQRVRERTLELVEMTRALERKSEQLEQASLTDPLSGLNNRRYLLQHIDQDLAWVKRRHASEPAPADSDLVFFLIDIDHFKQVNDELGHAAGDAVIRQIPGRLRRVFRAEDHLVRWGGEEFLIVARSTTREHAGELAERARQAVADQAFVLDDGSELAVTCSLGFMCFPPDPSRPDALDWHEAVAVADAALLQAKADGRNCWLGAIEADLESPPANAPLWLKAAQVRWRRGGPSPA